MLNRNIYGYDFEVFVNIGFWCVVFINYETKERTVIISNKAELENFYKLHKDDIFVGFNSRNYDQWVYKGILCGLNPCKVTNSLIVEGKNGFQVVRDGNKYPINNFDVGTIDKSLKQLEGFMGSMIKETSVPFDTVTPLTQEQIDEIVMYCTHDVSECLKVFDYKKEEFDSQLSLIEAFNLPMSMFNKTKAQLSAHILGAIKQHTLDDEFEITIPVTLVLSEKYKHIVEWYKTPKNMNYKMALKSNSNQDSRTLETMVAGVPHTFAWGGVHGAKSNYYAEGIILCCDVASLYPAIMIEYGYQSRKILNPEKYKIIKATRLEFKKNKDKRQLPYKIVLNATYGILKDKNNPLYDPLMSNNVCITGQLLLLDLIDKVEPYAELIQSNTDGIYLKVKDMETVELIKNIAKEWESRTHLDLEWDIYNKIYQKDVNNYLIIDSEGHYKSKGAYLKKLTPIDNDLPIINKALVEYFVHNTPIEETINNAKNLIDFQKIVKLTNLYKHVKHGDVILSEKVHRVFASTDENAKPMMKIKYEKGEEKQEKISYTPDKCFINNESMDGVLVPDYLDRQYYIDLANERLSQFLDTTEEKINETPNILYNCMLNGETFYNFLVNCSEKSMLNKTLETYIQADCCKSYGKTKRLLDFIPYFKLLYGKEKLTKSTLFNKIKDENILCIIETNGELNKTGKTYTNVNYEKILSEIFELLPDEDINVATIMKTQVDLFKDARYTNSALKTNRYYVLNTRNEIAPNVTLYRMNDGLIENRKVSKNAFQILPLYDGDIIDINTSEIRYGYKIVGKNEKGENELATDINKKYDVILSYDIVFRDYGKNSTLICEEGD